MRREHRKAHQVTEADLKWWLKLAPTLDWTWAKTYADSAPHWWIRYDRGHLSQADMARAAMVIRHFGEPGKFYGYTNIYLYDELREWKYWSMDPTVSTTDLINRAKADQVYGVQDAPSTKVRLNHVPTVYDRIAHAYDRMWSSDDDLEENREVANLLYRITSGNGVQGRAPSVLDVGCGTGLLMDLKVTSPEFYVGIDPAQAMLNQLLVKHPRVKHLLPGTFAETFPYLVAEGMNFELVASLFASASYLSPAEIRMLPNVVKPGGHLVLMTYEEGYVPDYYVNATERQHAIDTAAKAREAVVALATERKGKWKKIGKFETWVIRCA